MKKGLLLFSFLVSGLVFSQTKNEKTHYFYSIAYGQNNEVFVSNIYDIDIENQEIYSKLAERYTKFKNYLVNQKKINSEKDLQTGYEKNYYKKEQAIAEQKHLLNTLERQNFVIKNVDFDL